MILILLLLVSCTINAQPTPLSFSEVVTVDSVPHDELMKRAKVFLIEYFKDASAVIQMEDKEANSIMGKAAFIYQAPSSFFNYVSMLTGPVRYMIKIDFKDGRYRYEVSNFVHYTSKEQPAGGLIDTGTEYPEDRKLFQMSKGFWNDIWSDLKYECKEHSKAFSNSLKAHMQKPLSSQNDW